MIDTKRDSKLEMIIINIIDRSDDVYYKLPYSPTFLLFEYGHPLFDKYENSKSSR